MNPLLKFLVSPAGRITRVVAGLALIIGGPLVLGGSLGIVVAAVGVIPLLAGVFDLCVFAPLFGYSLSGPKTRATV